MNAFDPAELAYLAERRLARLATVGRNGTPHVTPVGMWHHNKDSNSIDITGHDKPIRPATAPPRWPGLRPPQVSTRRRSTIWFAPVLNCQRECGVDVGAEFR
jgi:hypothetical protein